MNLTILNNNKRIIGVFLHKRHTFRPSLNNQASSYLGCPLCFCLRAITCGIVTGSVSVARPMRSVLEPGWMTTTKLLCICWKIYRERHDQLKHNNVMHMNHADPHSDTGALVSWPVGVG